MVVSCSKDENGGGGGGKGKTYAEIKSLDIVGAEYLYSTGNATNSGRSTRAENVAKAQLFKILSNGTTEEVSIVDANGETIPVDVVGINPVTDDIIFFGYSYTTFDYNDGYGYDYYTTHSPAYFARVNDGAVFELPEMFRSAFGWTGEGNGFSEHLVGRGELFKDKYDNIYITSQPIPELYKIEFNSGITATKIASDLPVWGNELRGDILGNAVYYNKDQKLTCLTPSGKKFIINDNIWMPKFLPFPDNENGGFLHIEMSSFDGGETNMWHYKVNSSSDGFEKTLLRTGDSEEFGDPRRLEDKIVLINWYGDIEGNGTLEIIKSPTDIEMIDLPSDYYPEMKGHNFTDNYLYWYANNEIRSLNLETKEVKTLHQLDQTRTNSNFSFADDMIIFYSEDRQNDKTYLCEIKNGIYSETEIIESNTDNFVPTIIDFIRVN